MVESKSTALPLGDAPIRPLQLPRFRATPSARPSRCVLDHLVAPAGRRSGGMIAFGSFWQRRSIEGGEAFQPAGRWNFVPDQIRRIRPCTRLLIPVDLHFSASI